MTTLQTYQMWIGLGFVVLLVVFLIVAFFAKEQLTNDQRQILRFLCSLCAGFAGALITGDALFRMDAQIGAKATVAVSGTAGFALFFAVWFSFDPLIFADAVHFSIPSGWTFRQAVDGLVQQDSSVANYVGFTQAELSAPLQSQELRTRTMTEAIHALRSLATTTSIREYEVTFKSPTYRLQISS